MTAPARLYPTTASFPSSITPGVDGALGVVVNGLALSGTDGFGCTWRTFSPLVGWDGSPASSMQTTQKPRGPGGWPSPANLAVRAVSLSGSLDCPNADALQAALERLDAAITLTDFVLTLRRGTQTRSLIARRAGEVLVSDVTDTVVQWTVNLTALDPRKFAQGLSGTVSLPFSSGGLTVPLVVPVVVSSTGSVGTLSLTNPGNATGAVLVRIDGPVTGPKITHVTSGLQITFDPSLSLASGEFLIVDMEAQTALGNGEASRNAYLDYTSTNFGWPGFLPGVNLWAVDSAAYDPSTVFTITAIPAWQ